MKKNTFLILMLILFFTKNLFSQAQEDANLKDSIKKSNNSLENFPLKIGIEYGIPLKFNTAYFEKSITGYIGIGLDREKSNNFVIEYGLLKANNEIDEKYSWYLNLGGSIRIIKIDRTRFFGNLGYSIASVKQQILGGISAGLIYEYKLTPIFSISASIKFPMIRPPASIYDTYYHNPLVYLGIILLSF